MIRLLPLSAAALAGLTILTAIPVHAAVDPGEILIGEMNCVACHEVAEPIRTRLASRPSPRLDSAHAIRVSPQWLRAFLEDPQTVQPGTLMPDLLAGLEPSARTDAAETLTHYLVHLRGPTVPGPREAGDQTIAAGKSLYHTVGCVACHAPEEAPAAKAHDPEAGSALEKLRQVSVPMGDLPKKFPAAELAAFLQDPLKSRPGGRMPSLRLNPKESQAIAAYLLRPGSAPVAPVPGETSFTVDPAKVARGQEWFANLNCAACHPVDGPGRKAKPLAMLNGRQPAGCLGARPKAGVPKFEMSDRQKVVMLAQLANQASLTEPLTSEQQITRTMTTLNCYSCHARERRGGIDPLRRDYFTARDTAAAGSGDESRIPPSLRGVGAKLQPDWIKAVLVDGASVFPSMATRMPQYGERNVGHLPPLFAEADTRSESVAPPIATAEASHAGRKLLGTTGLACVACHNLGGHASTGVPGLDLATSGNRLQWTWFRRYLLDPQGTRPGTMPSFWPGGVAVNREILAGDAEKQVLAIWSYLTRKDFTDLPAGLSRDPKRP